MRPLVVSFLIIALLTQVFSKTIIYATFLVNQEYIAQNLCENRQAPEKHCCGKCQLKKRMEREQRQESLPASFKSADENVFEANPDPLTQTLPVQDFHYSSYSCSFTAIFPEAVFHPPSFV